jgi:hypothetical protein
LNIQFYAMKTLKQLSLFILTASAASVMAQGDPAPAAPAGNGGSDGVSWHPTADPKWPAGKDQVKSDSGQYSVTSYFVDRRAKKLSLGLGGGPTFFFGDADKIQPGWHIRPFVKYSISQTFGLRGEYNFGVLRGARDFQAPTLFKDNFQFRSKVQDFNMQMVFTLGNISFLRPLRKTQMYLFAGVGFAAYRTTATFVDQRLFLGDYYLTHYFGRGPRNPNLGKPVEERYEGRHAIIPFGFGFKHNLGRMFDLGLEYRQTWTRNDDIDGYNTAIFQNRWLDAYGMMNVNLAWKFGNKNPQHYDWLSPVENIYEKIADVEKKVDSLMADKDKDGVSDYFDVDDETPDTCMVYGNGQAVDTDRDGVPDCQDQEMFSDDGAEVDESGRMRDDDGDGIPNHRDMEPNSPRNAYVDARGRTINVNCCNCDDMVFPSIFFSTNSCVVRPEYAVVLYEVANKMRQCPDKKLTICGGAGAGKEKMYSGKGDDAAAACRVDAIINTLVRDYGMSRDRIIVDETCRPTDRNRVDFFFQGSNRRTTPAPAPAPAPGRSIR